MFYGNSNVASAQITFDQMFANSYNPAVDPSDPTTLSGEVTSYSYVRISSRIYVASNTLLHIKASKIVIETSGTLDGNAAGYAYNASGAAGQGRVPGYYGGGGGGAYGGQGGSGGVWPDGTAGGGGTAFGDPLGLSIDMGTFGSDGYYNPGSGGNGGGGVYLEAQDISVSGSIEMNANNGYSGGLPGGAGGSGGGILVFGNYVTIASTAQFKTKGGNGASCNANYAGGGGGGGGRIKIYHDSNASISAASSAFVVSNGSGGAGSQSSQTRDDGAAGASGSVAIGRDLGVTYPYSMKSIVGSESSS
jgi:hypothetical protein